MKPQLPKSLKQHPPRLLMKALGYRSIDSMPQAMNRLGSVAWLLCEWLSLRPGTNNDASVRIIDASRLRESTCCYHVPRQTGVHCGIGADDTATSLGFAQ